GARINFSVKDSGIGIPPGMHQKVFQPYYQIANQKGSHKGIGLGLSLVKRIIEDLHGVITIESNPPKIRGTKILVTLDKHTLLEKDSAHGYSIKNTDKPYFEDVEIKDMVYDKSKATILLVEDNVSMVNYLIKKLGENYNICSACNGNEALTKIKNLPVLPDIIISDVMMDKMDGFTFAKIISKDAVCNHIPLIFLSAKSTKKDKLLGLKLGAIDFIQKPFSIRELIQKMESILKNVEKQKESLRNTGLKLMNQPAFVQNNIDIFEQNCNLYNLTSRERDIAKLICQGYKYKNIGETLFIAERTVTKHAQNIFEKTEVKNKIELINKLEAKTALSKQSHY
ncbi:MAG TPA: response regulator, partial [Hanamia sp.]